MFRNLLLPVFILFSLEIHAQDRSVIDLFRSDEKKAGSLFEQKEYSRAGAYYQKLVKKDSLNSFFKIRLAECYRLLNNTTESEVWYTQVMGNSEGMQQEQILHYADVLMSNGKADSALYWYEKYHQQKDGKHSTVGSIQADALAKLMADSLAFSVSAVNFNSPQADFAPVYYKNGIVFLSSRKQQKLIRSIHSSDNSPFLDLYYTEALSDASYSKPVGFHQEVNSSLHEGSITFFDQGRKLVFSRNNKTAGEDGHKKLGLFYAELSEDEKKWINIKELPFCSTMYNVSHPFYHIPTNTLYFVSDMPGGNGLTDIYRSSYSEGSWSDPVNLGDLVNTVHSEMFPFVSIDSVLYFSSKGHGGLGGFDIFSVDLRMDSLILNNPGYPLNSSRDDFSFVLNEKNTEGFFASNRKNGGQDDDIYRVQVNRIRVEGTVADRLKSTPVTGARVSLVSIENGGKEQIRSDQKGAFTFYIIPGKRYEVEVQANGYKATSSELYGNNPEEKIRRLKIGMEKYNKAFVNGKVTLKGEATGVATVSVFDPTADTVEVLVTDSSGTFLCQINTDTSNILIAEANGKIGYYNVMPVKRKRKASTVQFVEIPLGTLDSITVTGRYVFAKQTDSVQIDSSLQIIIRNDWTNKEEALVLDENKKFSTKLWNLCPYTFFFVRNNRKNPIYTFEPFKENFIELIDK